MGLPKKAIKAAIERVDQGVGSDDDRRLAKQYRDPDPSPTSPEPEEAPAKDDPLPEGGDESSPGSSTSPSAEPQPTSEQPTTGSRRSRARTTANP